MNPGVNMPLTKDEKLGIGNIAREFGVERMWLFGSMLDKNTEPDDIDLAVEGIPPEMFFKFYARLGGAPAKNVDLYDMTEDIPIITIIRKKGKVIYECEENSRVHNGRKAAHS